MLVDDVEHSIRKIIPPDELEGMSDNIDVPISYDLAFYPTDNIGPQDAEILIQLSQAIGLRTSTSVVSAR